MATKIYNTEYKADLDIVEFEWFADFLKRIKDKRELEKSECTQSAPQGLEEAEPKKIQNKLKDE